MSDSQSRQPDKESSRESRARLFAKLAAITAFPIFVLLAFYASLNVTATNGSLFSNFGTPSGIYFTSTINVSQTTYFLVNESSIQNSSFPSLLPNISIPASFLILIILLVFVAVSISVVLNFRRQAAVTASSFDSELEKQRNEVADVLDKTISDLRQGGEYRQTVLECYRRISEILESRSKIDASSLTPREFSALVMARLKLDSPYLPQITQVFETARYSLHEISKSEADTAINCLSKLSSALREAGPSAGKE